MDALFKLLDRAVTWYTAYRLGKLTAKAEAVERQIEDLEDVKEIHERNATLSDRELFDRGSGKK